MVIVLNLFGVVASWSLRKGWCIGTPGVVVLMQREGDVYEVSFDESLRSRGHMSFFLGCDQLVLGRSSATRQNVSRLPAVS